MQLFEMQGLLAGKCLPGDIKVNESLAEYLLRKLNQRDELAAKLEIVKRLMDAASEINNHAKEATEKLVAQLDGLVAENAAMREAIDFATAPDMWQEQHDGMLEYRYVDWYVDVLNAALEPKSADAAIAEIKAQGVEQAADELYGSGYVYETLKDYATKLRTGRAE